MVCAWVIVAYGLARSGACWGAWARNRACVGAWVWSRARSSVMARGRVVVRARGESRVIF